jgi:large subunit ribosomal protein L10
MPHVASWKKEEVKNLKSLINNHKVVGIANLADIPAPQLQKMRRTLKDSATVKMSRKTLINLALNDSEKSKSNIETLGNIWKDSPL